MQRLILLGVIATFALPVFAAKPTTIAQLEQLLTAAAVSRKTDAQIAHQIMGIELSERLTEAEQSRLNERLTPNSQVAQALHLLASESIFLDPPAAEVMAADAPDEATQQQLLRAAKAYVARMLSSLPNFFATRTTRSYDDTPFEVQAGAWPIRAGLHLTNTAIQEISVRSDHGVEKVIRDSSKPKSEIGMTSWGEFGSTLALVLTDTVKGKVTWSHWEQIAGSQVAVFHFTVPRSASHYVFTNWDHRVKPGYNGSLWIDPHTGAILRISIELNPKDHSLDQFQHVGILVQYGPIEINGRRYICPLRSVAFSRLFTEPRLIAGSSATEWLNETTFTNYHRFATTTRIITDVSDPQ